MARTGAEQVRKSQEFELGSPEDLRRIAEVEVPRIETLKDLTRFLDRNRITESLGTAIQEHSIDSSNPVIRAGKRGPDTQRFFEAKFTDARPARGPQRTGISGITIEGSRSTPDKLLDYGYYLLLPAKSDFSHDAGPGHVRLTARMWRQRIDFGTSWSGRDWEEYDSFQPQHHSPVVAAFVAKAAAGELALQIEYAEKRAQLFEGLGITALIEG